MTSVLITGSSRGIGLEFARQYAATDVDVIATCRTPDKADELHAIEGVADVFQMDVADDASVCRCSDAIEKPIDILIANAALGGKDVGEFGDIDFDAWARLLNVNILGAIRVIEAFTPHLKLAGGRVAVISSNLASIELASGIAPAYSTSKAGLNMAVKSIAPRLAMKGIAIGLFHPGWVATDMGGSSAPVSPEESVAGLRKLIGEIPVTDSPRFLDYHGDNLPW